MSFQASEYSNLTQDDYGAASTDWVEVKDVPGDVFRVYSDGVVEHVKTGTTWAPTANVATYNQVVANLADVSGNEEKMASVLGADKVSSAISQAAPYTEPAGGSSPDDPMPEGKVPLTQRWWFWPTVILGSTATVGGTFLYATRTESGRRQWAKLTKKNPSPQVLSTRVIEII